MISWYDPLFTVTSSRMLQTPLTHLIYQNLATSTIKRHFQFPHSREPRQKRPSPRRRFPHLFPRMNTYIRSFITLLYSRRRVLGVFFLAIWQQRHSERRLYSHTLYEKVRVPRIPRPSTSRRAFSSLATLFRERGVIFSVALVGILLRAGDWLMFACLGEIVVGIYLGTR